MCDQHHVCMVECQRIRGGLLEDGLPAWCVYGFGHVDVSLSRSFMLASSSLGQQLVETSHVDCGLGSFPYHLVSSYGVNTLGLTLIVLSANNDVFT